MGDNSKISWTNATWNPVTGCTKVSQGCKHCYAEAIADRMWAKQYPPNSDGTPRRFTDVRLHPERLDQPLHWKKPRMIFVNSMSDLFHPDVPFEFIDHVFAIMSSSRGSRHIYQILTKRAERMHEYISSWREDHGWWHGPGASGIYFGEWPLPNIWLGVSVEDQKAADDRIPFLLETPAAVRFLSCEPLLGPINLDSTCRGFFGSLPNYPGIDWVIVGGESGPNARPMHLDWLRSIIEQCRDAGVPVFVKQDSGPRPGMQGRIPDELWIKEFPK